MDSLIGLDEGRGDIGRSMYNGELLYRNLRINPIKIIKYIIQRTKSLKR